MKNAVGILVGTRPTLVKHAPIIRELTKRKLPFFIVHAGQHYSYEMDRVFFRDLEIPYPRYVLKSVRKTRTPGEQTAEMLSGIERILIKEKPAVFLVGGDTNANLAGALAARKLHLTLGHIEAGCRSFDWRMPEEHNRVIIDHISDWLFTPSAQTKRNLLRENVQGKIRIVGSSIVDAVEEHQKLAVRKSHILERLKLPSKGYVVVTAHREHNVESKSRLSKILRAIGEIPNRFGMKVVFPIHPRTLKRLKEFGLNSLMAREKEVQVIDPLGYLDFLHLLTRARMILTDSGGAQQEACILGTPCVTLRENTEWTETLKGGANRITGVDPESILKGVAQAIATDRRWKSPFPRRASQKIVAFIKKELY